MPEACVKFSRSIIAVLAVSTAACQEARGPHANDESAELMPPDDWIMARAYDPLRRLPENFRVDERAETQRSYSLHHITDPSDSFERCTNLFDTAYRWEAEDHALRAVQGVYVGAYENERYFELVRELSYTDQVGNAAGITSPGFARVFKCSYVRRDGVDRHLRDGYAGTLEDRPLRVETVRDFAEYLWQFEFFPSGTATVLDTYSAELPNALEHTLRIAVLLRREDKHCDRIDVFDWTYTANRADGSVDRRFNRRHRLQTELVNGSPRTCVTD